MAIRRTIDITLTPVELAAAFTDMSNEEQAEFLNHVGEIARQWESAGWCVQACEIAHSRALSDDGRRVVSDLAGHFGLIPENV